LPSGSAPIDKDDAELIRLLGESIIRELLKRLRAEPETPPHDQGVPPVPSRAPTPRPAADLKRIHRRLLEHATREPVTSRKLITAAGYKFNAYSRGALTYLCRHGLLVRDAWGRYALPSSPST
jgi:hypothetical protein